MALSADRAHEVVVCHAGSEKIEHIENAMHIFPVLVSKCSLLLIMAFLLVGCGEEQFKATTDLKNFQKKYEEREKNHNQNHETIFSPTTLSDENMGDYRLGPGDLLSVKVFETDELDAEVRVSSRGFVSLPLLDDINVYDMSAAEAEELIENLYQEKYLRDPHVTIYIKEHVSKQITLVGAISRPGTYDYVTKRRLLDVIAIANGLSEVSGSIAYVTRENPATRKSISYLINLDELLKEGNMAQNMVILGGDVIFVPESGQCFVDGAVRKPGTYALETKMTITEVIALAGGLASYADVDGIKLIRYMGSGKQREIVSLSYSDLQGGIGDTLFLQDQDVIFAESSASGILMSGTGVSIGFMGTGVTFRDPAARHNNY